MTVSKQAAVALDCALEHLVEALSRECEYGKRTPEMLIEITKLITSTRALMPADYLAQMDSAREDE